MVTLIARGRPVRAPWPAHARLNGKDIPLALLSKTGARLVATVPPDQPNVAPEGYGEQAKNPVFGAPYAIRDLTRGMGQRRARQGPNGRYWYTLNARCRSGRRLQGPALTNYTPGTLDSTIGIIRWFEIGGRIFAGNGRYALSGSTDGTGWTVSKDFGAGKAMTDVIVLQTNQASSTRYAQVAMGDGENLWYFDGASATTTWTQTTGANAFKARAWAKDAENVYWANDANKLNQCSLDADVLVVANHAAATDRIGTYDHPVVRMTVNGAGSLVACKQDDIYFLQADGSWRRAFEDLQFPPAATNGEALARWVNHHYVTYGNATYRLADDGGLTPVGPELLKDNGSEVNGYVSAMVGTDFFLLAGLYNPDNAKSYLLEFTGELVADEQGRAEPVWHGSITAAFSAKKILSLHTSTIGAPAGHKMAYIGFSDGTISKYVLAHTPDPADCTSEVFSTGTSEVYHSRAYFGFPSERKALLRATGEGDNLSSSNKFTLHYRPSGAGSYTAMTSAFDAGERESVDFPDASSCVFLDTKEVLSNAAATASPQVSGLAILYQTRPVPQEVLAIAIPAEDSLRKRDGTPYRLGAEELHDFVDQLAGFSGGVPFIDSDGDSHQVLVHAPQKVTAWLEGTKQPVKAIRCLLIEQEPNETRGLLQNLEAYTLEQLEAFLLAQLEEVV